MVMVKKSSTQLLVEDIVKREGLTGEVESNHQTLLLLIHDAKFQRLVKKYRTQFGIPLRKGFRPKTKKLKDWAESLDYDKWDAALWEILVEYPRLNENFLQHISLYIRFNSVYYGPIFNHKVGLAQLGRQKRDWVTVTLYDVPDGADWRRIKSEVDAHFIRQDVEKKHPIENFEKKLRALERNPKLISGVIDESGYQVSDEALADRLINQTGAIDKEKSSINLIRQYRRRLRAEKKKRLG